MLSNDDQIKHHVHVLEQKVGQLTIECDFLEQGYMRYYHEKRPHQGINNEIPNARYKLLKAIKIVS